MEIYDDNNKYNKIFSIFKNKIKSILSFLRSVILNKKKFSLKASQIDNFSRFLFPTFFLIFQIIYWTYYLKMSSNEISELKN
jgi:hypothetical protein